jgi:hypothetical protein
MDLRRFALTKSQILVICLITIYSFGVTLVMNLTHFHLPHRAYNTVWLILGLTMVRWAFSYPELGIGAVWPMPNKHITFWLLPFVILLPIAMH